MNLRKCDRRWRAHLHSWLSQFLIKLINNIKRIKLNMFIFELIVNRFPIKTRCYKA